MSKTDDRLEIMENNNMLYDCDESLSCIVQKELRQNRFISGDVDDYKEGYQLICNFDAIAEDEFINPTNSYINLSLNVNSTNDPAFPDSTTNYSFGSNYNINTLYTNVGLDQQKYKSYFTTGASVLNLFHRVELFSPTGQIIFSERFFNQNRTARQYELSQERMNTINAMMGGLCYDKKIGSYLFPVFSTSAGNEKAFTNFSIPLSELGGFFNQKRPLPGCVLKNCVLRITLEKPNTCFYLGKYGIGQPSFGENFAKGFSVDIKNIFMNYQSVKVFDSIQKIVKHNTIQIPYKTKFTVRNKISSSTCEMMIPLTAANVFNVQLKFIRDDYNLINSQTDDGQGGFIYNYNQRSPMYANDFSELMDDAVNGQGTVPTFKIRVGEYYYPQYNPSQIQDYFIMTCEALNPMCGGGSCQDVDPKYNNSSIGCVNYQDYSFNMATYVPITIQPTAYGLSTGGSIVAFDLKRNKDLGLSGITINAQRKLNVMMSNIRAIDQNSKFDVYVTVEYLQILEYNYKDGKITIMK